MTAPYSQRLLIKAWNLFRDDEENIHSSYNALKIIQTEHERVHAGRSWYHNQRHYIPPSTTVYYAVKVDSNGTSDIHLRNYGYKSDQGPMHLLFYENPYLDANSLGTLLPLYNLNRLSSALSGCSLYGGPVVNVSSLGTSLGYVQQPTSAPGNQPAGGIGEVGATEWVLSNSYYYLFSLQNTAVNTATIESSFLVYRTD